MKRRDLIIVAVLVNAGLLIVLCVSALKSDGARDEMVPSSVSPLSSVQDLGLPSKSASTMGDEVDHVLSQHAMAPAPASIQNPALQTVPSSSPALPAIPSFADDLKAITFSEPALPSPATVEKAAASAVSEVKVQKGDMLEKIARRHGISVEELMRANQLKSTNLKIGQTLKIPEKKAVAAKVQSSAQPAAVLAVPSLPSLPAEANASAQYYTVKNGDNPWTIAVKNHIKVEELLKLNDLDGEKAKRLKPGDQLRIR